jgi:hypothetical protein
MNARIASATVGVLAALGMLFVAKHASADPTAWESRRRVVVLSDDWEVAARLRRLLAGVSLEATITAEETPCDPLRVKRAGASALAASVVCMDEAGLEVWTLEDNVKAWTREDMRAVFEGRAFQKRERIAWATTPPTIRDEAIVQATEIVRANVASMTPLPPEPSPPPPRSPLLAAPVEHSVVTPPPPPPPEPDTASAKPNATVPASVEPRNTAPLVFGAGPAFMSSTGYDPAWGAAFEAEYGYWSNVSLAVNAMLPLTTSKLGYPGDEKAGARTMSFGAGVEIPLLPADSIVIPRVGGGVGVVWMHTQALVAAASSSTQEQDFVLPQFYGDAALSIRLYGRARIVLAGTVAATTSQMVIRVNDTEQGRFGWPIGMVQFRLEAQL